VYEPSGFAYAREVAVHLEFRGVTFVGRVGRTKTGRSPMPSVGPMPPAFSPDLPLEGGRSIAERGTAPATLFRWLVAESLVLPFDAAPRARADGTASRRGEPARAAAATRLVSRSFIRPEAAPRTSDRLATASDTGFPAQTCEPEPTCRSPRLQVAVRRASLLRHRPVVRELDAFADRLSIGNYFYLA
jgi:hypothetical protein